MTTDRTDAPADRFLAADRHELRVEGVRLTYGDRVVIDGLDREIRPGAFTVIIGPNACGKSTLLRAVARLLKPTGGRVVLDGADIASRPTREIAKVLGILPQESIAPEGITVAELVGRGRHPHRAAFRSWTPADEAIVVDAMVATSTLDFAARPVAELSGGQRQRVWIAMALAQQTDVLLLDEPTTFLDITHQLEVLELVRELNRTRGTTVVAVLHDLNLAARYADELVVMEGGRVVAAGAPGDVLTAEVVAEAFALDALVVPDPVTGTPLVVPRGKVSA